MGNTSLIQKFKSHTYSKKSIDSFSKEFTFKEFIHLIEIYEIKMDDSFIEILFQYKSKGKNLKNQILFDFVNSKIRSFIKSLNYNFVKSDGVKKSNLSRLIQLDIFTNTSENIFRYIDDIENERIGDVSLIDFSDFSYILEMRWPLKYILIMMLSYIRVHGEYHIERRLSDNLRCYFYCNSRDEDFVRIIRENKFAFIDGLDLPANIKIDLFFDGMEDASDHIRKISPKFENLLRENVDRFAHALRFNNRFSKIEDFYLLILLLNKGGSCHKINSFLGLFSGVESAPPETDIIDGIAKYGYILEKFDLSYIPEKNKKRIHAFLFQKERNLVGEVVSFLPIINEEEPLPRKMMRCVVFEHTLLLGRRFRQSEEW